MQSHASTLEAAGSLDPAVSQLLAAKDKSIEELTARVEALSRQLDWLRRQMFGSKSERLVLQDNAQQISLGEMLDQGSAVAAPPKRRVVAEHTRAVSKAKDEGESLPFFDATPMGRKNWNFCWTELGAEHVGIMQSLIVTCRLHGIDPYTYLVDVLQRVGVHPASTVAELTPRLWKLHFAANPMRSALHTLAA